MRERKMARLMLPGDWQHMTPKIGLNRVSSKDFEERLYDSLHVESSGVPSLLAHPYGFTQALRTQPPNHETMVQFSCLVRGIFLGIIDVTTGNLPDNVLTRVLQSFDPGFNQYYILKWKKKVVGGIYPYCFVFPGAKFIRASAYEKSGKQNGIDPEPDYKGVTFQALELEIKEKTAQSGKELVQALFALWIQEIMKEPGLQSDRNGNSPFWLQRLQDVSNGEWKCTVKAPDNSINIFTRSFITVPLRHEDYILDIPLRRIEKNIFCEKIVKFANGKVPDVPIKFEHLGLVNIDKSEYEWKDNDIIYHVQLKGWPQSIEWIPREVVSAIEASILLFPSFRAKGWNINYAFFASSAAFGGEEPSLRLINDSFKRIGELSKVEGCMTKEPVGYVEILLRDDQAGVFKDNRDFIGEGQINATISLDFGTTHSSIGIRGQNADEYELFNFEDMSYDLLETYYFASNSDSHIKQIREGCFWFPPAAFDGELSILPSELVFTSELLLPEGDANLDEPIRKFTIPHPQIERAGLHKIIVANFKWNSTKPFSQKKLIKSYIKIVLHMALAVLRKKYMCTHVSIVPTFPLAFGKERYEEFKDLLVGSDLQSGLLVEISRELGVSLTPAIVNTSQNLKELVAESYAAKVFCSPSQTTAELVVDIGGGSTDIALSTHKNEFVDSFQYGANRYLEYLAREFPAQPPGIKNANERFIALQKKMRGGGIKGVLEIYPDAQKATARQSIDRFFQGLFEYLQRLLNMAGAKNVNLFPVGNGWRLIEGYVKPNNNIDDYVKNWFMGRDINFAITLPPRMDYKGQVCKGAMRIADGGWYVPPKENEYSKTILGGNIVVAGIPKKWNEIVPTGPLLTERPYAIDVTPFVDSLPFSPRPRPNMDLSTISGQLAAHCRAALYPCPGGSYGLNRSIFAIFLETIYPGYYL